MSEENETTEEKPPVTPEKGTLGEIIEGWTKTNDDARLDATLFENLEDTGGLGDRFESEEISP